MMQGVRQAQPAPSPFMGCKSQQGFTLLLALLFVALFGGILVVIVRFNDYQAGATQARIAGWEIVQIAKAARLYVRDQYVINPALRDVAATPTSITINTLKAGGYLPTTFGRSNNKSVLKQKIDIAMVNWSPDGLGGNINSPTTVPTAFVYFGTSSEATPSLIITAVENARRLGANITAPLFDFNGNNFSADCRGDGPAVGLWDTGCLTKTEFATIANAIGISPTFPAGALIMPAWKASPTDLRSVMRFPQPENAGYSTMLTDLQMGTPLTNCTNNTNRQISITTTTATGEKLTAPSGICDVLDDTGSLDRRFDIDEVANIRAERMIAQAQSGNDDVFTADGNVTMDADLRIYDVRALPGGVTSRLNISNGSLVAEKNMYVYSQSASSKGQATIGNITDAKSLVSDNLTTSTFKSLQNGTSGSIAQINVTSTTDLTRDVTVTGTPTAEFITETIDAPNATVRASASNGNVQVTGTLDLDGSTMQVNGMAPIAGYAAIVGEIVSADTITATNTLSFPASTGSLSIPSAQDYGDTANPMKQISTSGRCLENKEITGACPERQYFPPSITP